MTISGNTYLSEIVYVTPVIGGVGLFGLEESPDLRATVFGLDAFKSSDVYGYILGTELEQADLNSIIVAIYETYNDLSSSISVQPYSELYGYVAPNIRLLQSGHTGDSQMIYLNLVQGGIGLYGISNTPDLLANIIIQPKLPDSGTATLNTEILAIQRTGEDLHGYIRTSVSGFSDFSSQISGSLYKDLYAYIRTVVSGKEDLTFEIEAIPPQDLFAALYGYNSADLPVDITIIPPVELTANISGVKYVDLMTTLQGYDFFNLSASCSGIFGQELGANISGSIRDYLDINGQIKGFSAVGQDEPISGYILPLTSLFYNISGNILGVSRSDLNSIYTGVYHIEDLLSNISGVDADWLLHAMIAVTGSVSDLMSYVIGNDSENTSISGYIDGYAYQDLVAAVNVTTGTNLHADLSVTGVDSSYLYSYIDSNLFDLYAEYVSNKSDTLSGNIEVSSPLDLYGVIVPKVYYIDSSIPLNLYAVSELRAVINSDVCDKDSAFENLHAFISGTLNSDLEASVVSVVGQYALASDELPIVFKNNVISSDWMFFIMQPPVLVEDKLKIILTNSPLFNLYANIEGILPSTDLGASISSSYISSVVKTGSQIGEWVNTKTGERKVLKLFFRGDIKNFYYSQDANTTYSEDPDTFLELFVESYEKVDEDLINTFLYQKKDVKRHIIKKLSDFASIDDAVRFAILGAVSEIHGDLGAYITATGGVDDLSSTISGIDSKYIKDLNASLTSSNNIPDLYASVSGFGSVFDLKSYISPALFGNTSTSFIDSLGIRYKPQVLVHGNNDYSIVLTKYISDDIINVTESPDLFAAISGSLYADFVSNISGSL